MTDELSQAEIEIADYKRLYHWTVKRIDEIAGVPPGEGFRRVEDALDNLERFVNQLKKEAVGNPLTWYRCEKCGNKREARSECDECKGVGWIKRQTGK